MRSAAKRVDRFAVGLVAILWLVPISRLCAENAGSETKASPEELVQAALRAEAEGNAAERKTLLDKALAEDSNFAPARWHSGFVQIGNQWLTSDGAASARTGKARLYNRMRARAEATSESQLKLARWCESAGLKEQERVHLTNAMYLEPTEKQRREIIAKLDLVPFRGTLMPRAQLDAVARQSKDAETAAREWTPRQADMKRDLASPDRSVREKALNDLRSIRDPAAIPLLENSLQAVSGAGDPTEIGQAAVAALAAMPKRRAADALARTAVFNTDKALRKSAAEALRSRSLFAYVPQMIGAMQPITKAQLDVFLVGGLPCHRLVMFEEGATANYALESVGRASVQVDVTTHVRSGRTPEVRTAPGPDTTLREDLARAGRVAESNSARAILNQQIADALNIAAGKNFDSNEQTWWNWWNDYNEMYQPPYKPTFAAQRYSAPYSVSVKNVSCFVAGTPVWTLTGRTPIQEISVGDCVLSQNADSGELAYKAVLATTVRPPSPLVEIHVGRGTIRATRGHPFWVDGLGWQMAKELKAGQYLHSPKGAVLIDRVSQNGAEECYNLVVADFNSYFVGAAQVLVHDNNLRDATIATVPGLAIP